MTDFPESVYSLVSPLYTVSRSGMSAYICLKHSIKSKINVTVQQEKVLGLYFSSDLEKVISLCEAMIRMQR